MRVAPAATLLSLLLAPAAAAQVDERAVDSAASDARVVSESVVRIHAPLGGDAGEHPEACDFIESLRFRHARGPERAADADAVVVLIPGFLEGAGAFDQVARHTIREAAARGAFVEVWSLDRRSNCLEDDTGLEAAHRAEDASVAYDYYWRGKEVDGKRFAGFVPPERAEFLRTFGLKRTMEDWMAVLRVAVPDQAQRAKKVICGGHSLGGPLTAAFSSWDFDGDPQTTEDAGYNQCAGLVGFDTTVALERRSGGGGSSAGTQFASGAAPYVNVTPLTPETMQVPAVFGVGAFHDPQQTDLLRNLPSTPNIDTAQRALFSRDAAHFATGSPSIRDFTLTNELVLAGVFDDNSAPLSFLRASLGFLTGGPVVEKTFPTDIDTLALPEDPDRPLYSWVNYDRIVDDEVPRNDDGDRYTSRESEVSNLHDFARTMFEAPANFTEQYFPTRLLADVAAVGAGDRGGDFAAIQHDGPAQRAIALIQAADSDDNDARDDGPPQTAKGPNDKPNSRVITLPGYNHLDVLTAARAQNDGRPEPSSAALSSYVIDVVQPTLRPAITDCRARRRLVVRNRVRRARRAIVRVNGVRRRTVRSRRAIRRVVVRLPSGRARVRVTFRTRSGNTVRVVTRRLNVCAP
jgi:hypothetical protein